MVDDRELYLKGLFQISPLAGREVLFSRGLETYLSEGALHMNRAHVEIENIVALSESDMHGKPIIDEETKSLLRSLIKDYFDAGAVADYDHFGRSGIGPFEHDVKAVEFHLKDLFDLDPKLASLKQWIHFPMTSEDVNNIAYNLGLRGAVNKVWLPAVFDVGDQLAHFAGEFAVPVVGKTHGMNASPTTVGKRFGYHLSRLSESLRDLPKVKLSSKFSGPVGNHNAMLAVSPSFDFESYARRFVEGFGFRYSPVENQRISHHSQLELLGLIQAVNLVGQDIAENIRHQVMMGWLYLEGNKSHVGSSVMPHKINPWFFEVGQGFLEVSGGLIDSARSGLKLSVMERDLTDHPWERMYGEMIGYSLVGLRYLSRGLSMIRVDEKKCLDDLDAAPEVLSEVIQIAGRLCGVDNAYMQLKDHTRGKKVTLAELRIIAGDILPPGEIRERVLASTPATYIGMATKLAEMSVREYVSLKSVLSKGVLGERND